MTQIASLPTITVQIAFTPTDLLSSTQTWTDVTNYVRSFATHGGRQHFLNRIEASTVNITLDNRTGFFMNGDAPIPATPTTPFIDGNGTGAIIGTRLPIQITATWSSTTYTIFTGIIDTVETRLQDALNSDLMLTATDKLKYLSLRYLYNGELYRTYAATSSSRSWYNKAQGNVLQDNVGTYNGTINGPYQLTDGVLLYDRTQAIDVTNGSQDTNTADIWIPNSSNVSGNSLDYSIDFWVIGQSLQNVSLLPISLYNPGGFSMDVSISVDVRGTVSTANGLQSSVPINDGYWHHVAIINTAGGTLSLVIDGVATSASGYGGAAFTSPYYDSLFHIANAALCYVDQITIGNSTVTLNDIKNRYAAGILLRQDQNTADRIAATMVIAGQATIVEGVVTAPNFYVDNAAYSPGASTNGLPCQGSLTSVIDNTALDVIQTASDTDQGAFFQADDGTFQYETRTYIYRPAANATPTGSSIWTDDTSSTIHYEAGSFQLTRDDADVWTTVIVSPQNGTPQIYTNTSNVARWGQSTLTVGTTGTSLDQAYQQAVYLGKTFASPLARVGNVTLMSETDNGASLTAMLSANLNDRIRIKRHPINASTAGITDTDMLIESINHEFEADPGFWHTTFVLDPYPIRFSTQTSPTYFLVADDATYGHADQQTAI
jgi:hypothetical protein